MNKAEELQVLTEKSKNKIDNKVNKRTEKWMNKRLIPFLEELAKDGKYSVDYSSSRQCFYTTAIILIDHELKCRYFKKNININFVQTRLKEMGFYVQSYRWDDDFCVYWDKGHIDSK